MNYRVGKDDIEPEWNEGPDDWDPKRKDRIDTIIGLVVALGIAAILVFVMTGCSGGSPTGPALQGREVPLDDGRIVTCVRYDAGYGGSVDCDWEHTR